MGSDISKIISCNKFLIWNKFFHIADNRLQGGDKTNKFKKFYLQLKNNWSKVFSPGHYLTLDQGVAAFQGRTEFKQYMPAKPEKWGLKIYLVSDSHSDYILSAILYSRKSEKTIDYTIKLVIKILSEFMWKGHKVFMDSFNCCPTIVIFLHFKEIYVSGISRLNRQGMPSHIKDFNLQENNCRTYSCDFLHLDAFRDKKKTLSTISSFYSNKITENSKPQTLAKYGKYMNSVDKANQKNSYYRFPHKNIKCWKVFFFELLEISITNSYIIYKQKNSNKLSHKEYRLEIVEGLIRN